MTIQVNIAEAKARLSELVAASLNGEEVVLSRAGVPQARIVPLVEAEAAMIEARIAKRKAAFGKYRKDFEGFDTSIEAFQNLYPDPYEDYERKFGTAT
jgi:prevent-host-death family protein